MFPKNKKSIYTEQCFLSFPIFYFYDLRSKQRLWNILDTNIVPYISLSLPLPEKQWGFDCFYQFHRKICISLIIFRILYFLQNFFPMHCKGPPITPFSPNIKRAPNQNPFILGFSQTLYSYFIRLEVLKTYLKKRILFANNVLMKVLFRFCFLKLLF